MSTVQVIKARKLEAGSGEKNAPQLRVAAYCRVSTDEEDQLHSYQSQVEHYTELIHANPKWKAAGIYADAGITGTQTAKRDEFNRLIQDCMDGKIDMVITKSISRFARNTLDTLTHVRMLKERGIAVFFEEENINTLSMDSELLLVVLSSVAQQEVENTSQHVKKGLKMKMMRGELVGFQGCLGYDYSPETKQLTVNPKEAETVKYIFHRYLQGAGGKMISRELMELGYRTKRGGVKWRDSVIIQIIKNEKYKGDLILGKTFTVDPLSKRRIHNLGEEDQYYVANHHEAIVSAEDWEAAQQIRKKRAQSRKQAVAGKRELMTRKYTFSSMLRCGFCGSKLTRRCWHANSKYERVIWQCMQWAKYGKTACPKCKGISEVVIESAFVEAYNKLYSENQSVLKEFVARVSKSLSNRTEYVAQLELQKELDKARARRDRFVDMRIDNLMTGEAFAQKYKELTDIIDSCEKKLAESQIKQDEFEHFKIRMRDIQNVLASGAVLEKFDRGVFESIVDHIVVGGYDEEGREDPLLLTIVFKTGGNILIDGTQYRPHRLNASSKNEPSELCENTVTGATGLLQINQRSACGDGMFIVQTSFRPTYRGRIEDG